MEPTISESNTILANKIIPILPYNDNIVLSPFSIYNTLFTLLLGSEGDTKTCIQDFCNMPSNISKFIQLFNHLNNLSDISLSVNNKIIITPDYTLNNYFVNQVRRFSSISSTTFDTKLIIDVNNWVDRITNGLIKSIIDESIINCKMLSINVIYFKGLWKYPFDVKNTKPRDFYIGSPSIKTLKHTMLITNTYFEYCYSSEINASILKMKYINNDFEMVFILPNTSVLCTENKMSNINLNNLNFKYGKFNQVTIPKFKIESNHDLKILKNIGLNIFSPNSDFRNFTTEENNLFVDQFIQNAIIIVDEKGTEAAAVTCFTYGFGAPEKEYSFICNKSFLFQLTYKKDLILFNGRVIDPIF